MTAHCLDDFERLARQRLPRPLFAYIAGAAEDGLSFDANRESFREWSLVPRVLRDMGDRSSAVQLFGARYSAPFGIAPMGLAGMMAFEGDLSLARAASNANIPMALSGTSLLPLEEVCRIVPGLWFQAYLPGEPERIAAMIERISRTPVEALVLTVDVCVSANRENLLRAGFSTPLRPSLRLAWEGASHPRWLLATLARTFITRGMPHFENSLATRGPPIFARTAERDFGARDRFAWDHVALIRRLWPRPLVLKGILSQADAQIARDHGVDGMIISNHGGRQLDASISPLRALPGIIDVAGDLPVMIDSGFRRGTDVVKALALGARMVFVGRPFMFAAAAQGQSGVERAIALLLAEIDRDMALLGVKSLIELDHHHVRRTGSCYGCNAGDPTDRNR